MKVTITSLPQPKQVTITSLPQDQQPESYGQQAKRVATATGLKGAENLESIAGLAKTGLLGLGSLFGMKEPALHQQLIDQGKAPKESISQLLQQKSGYTPEQLQPQNAAENFIQRFGSQAPLNALLGGLPGLASTAIGSGVASGAGALGAPEGLQDFLQLGSEIGYGIHKGRVPTAGYAQKKAYETATNLAGEATSSVTPIQNALHEASIKLGKETTKKVSDEITHALAIVEKNVGQMGGKLKVKDALDIRRKLGETYETVSKNAKPYINDVRNSINQFFSDYSVENPQFFKALNKADKLTMMKHQKTSIDKFSNFLLDTFPGVAGSAGKATAKTIGIPLHYIEKIGRNITTNHEAQKHYLNVAKAASTQNVALFVNSLRKLDASME